MLNTNDQESTERWVLDLCREIGVRTENADSDFFEAGGNSLAAMKLISRAELRYGEDALPPDDLFTSSSVREIAASILRNRTMD
jgi:acyl carrier protein